MGYFNGLCDTLFLFFGLSGFWQGAYPVDRTGKHTCYPFANDDKDIGVRNRWVTLFPPSCLPGISVYSRWFKAYYPSALSALAKWLSWNVNLPQEGNIDSEVFISCFTVVNLTWASWDLAEAKSECLSRVCNHQQGLRFYNCCCQHLQC